MARAPRVSVFFLRRSKLGLRLPGLARLAYERILSTMKSSVRKCVSPHGPREFLGPGPTGATRSSRGRHRRSKPRDERTEEHSRRRGAQQGAEGRPTGRVVGAVFLMTISWAVSPHPHRVAHFKYHEIVFTGRSVCFSVCSRESLARAPGSPFSLFGQRSGFDFLGSLASLMSAF